MAVSIILGLVVGYCITVYSDYLIHRNIWHGRWKIVHQGPFRWLLYPHFVHHMRAHHSHAANHREILEAGREIPPESHRQIESKFQSKWEVVYGLRCTQHGITIRGLECHFHYLLVFLFTPQPYIAVSLWYLMGPAAGVPALMMPLCAIVTQVSHRFYHMSRETRRNSTAIPVRWLVCTTEFDRLADEHQKHHYDPERSDDYYGVLPFGNLLMRPLIGKN